MHLHSKLEDIVQTLALGLGLGDVVSPNVAIYIREPTTTGKGMIGDDTYIPCLLTRTA